jgi:hypothetical protein
MSRRESLGRFSPKWLLLCVVGYMVVVVVSGADASICVMVEFAHSGVQEADCLPSDEPTAEKDQVDIDKLWDVPVEYSKDEGPTLLCLFLMLFRWAKQYRVVQHCLLLYCYSILFYLHFIRQVGLCYMYLTHM